MLKIKYLLIKLLFFLVLACDLNAAKTNFFFLQKTNTVEEPPIYSPGWFIRGTNFGGNSFSGTQIIGYANAVALDSYGNIYMGGQYNYKPVLYKIDSKGNLIWVYTTPSGGGGEIKRISIDKNNNIFITGNFAYTQNFGGTPLVSNGGYDIFIVKLNSNGQHIWSKHFGATGFSSTPTETGNGLAIDPTDNSVILGAIFGDGIQNVDPVTGIVTQEGQWVDFGGGPVKADYPQDSIIVKLSNDGNFIWNRHFRGYINDIVVDKTGGVYGTGYFWTSQFNTNITITNYSGTNPDAFVVKYSANNVFQWVNHYGQLTTQSAGRGIAIDNNGDLVFVGFSMGINNFGGLMLTNRGADDIILAKYNGYNGNHIWSKSIGSWNVDYARGIGVDAANRITIAGIFNKSLNFSDGNILNATNPNSFPWQVFIANFEEDGSLLWARCFSDNASRLESVFVKPEGRIYVAGRMGATNYFDNFILNAKGRSDSMVLELSEQSKINIR